MLQDTCVYVTAQWCTALWGRSQSVQTVAWVCEQFALRVSHERYTVYHTGSVCVEWECVVHSAAAVCPKHTGRVM